jgi:multicomponent Na+:H+ antiporter subunit G
LLMTYREIAIIVLASIGVTFTFISAIGIVRLPDVYARMHAAGKASTLGVTCILLSAAVVFPGQLMIVVILIILFFATAPIATTTMARAAYRTDDEKDLVLHYDDIAKYDHAVDVADANDGDQIISESLQPKT